MKKKNSFLTLSLVFLTAGILVACYENEFKENCTRLTYEEEIAAAREYYESLRLIKTHNTRTFDLKTEKEILANMEPLWGMKYSFRRKNKNSRTVEAVMTGGKYSNFMLSEVREKYLATKDARYKQSMSRLVVETDLKTDKMQAFIMTIVPSLLYLEQTNFKPFYNTYLIRDKYFSGWILFHEIDGRFANGWQYSDGQITHSISKAENSLEDYDLQKPQTRSGYQECEMFDIWILVEECMEWHTVTEYQHSIEEGNCNIYWEYQGRKEVCRWVSEGSTSSGGSGTGGGYVPDPTMPGSLNSLFKKNRIGEDIELVAQTYENLFENCLNIQMGNYIARTKFVFNAIQYDESMGGEASIGSAGNLSFRNRDCIQYDILQHEYFHMFQCAVAGNFTDYLNIKNVCATEFERHLYEDICAMLSAGSDWAKIGRSWACTFETGLDKGGQIEARYKVWLATLTHNGEIFPKSLPVDKYREYLSLYWEKSRKYGQRIGLECDIYNSEPIALNIALADAVKNCSSIF